MSYFSSIISSPHFEDENKNYAAAIFHFVLWFTIIANIFDIVADPFIFSSQALYTVAANITLLVIQVGLFVLLRKGRIQLASIILTVLLWLILAVGAYNYAGILNPVFALQTLVILVAGLLLGQWAGLGFAALGSGYGLWLVQAAVNGRYAQSLGSITVQQTWLSTTTVFGLVGVLRFLSLRLIREARQEAAQQSLNRQRSEELYHSLVQNVPATIFTLNRAHAISFLNYSIRWPVEDLIGHSVYEFIHPDSHEIYRNAVNRVFEQGTTEQIEIYSLNEDKKYLYYIVRFAPVRKDGQVTEVTAIATDITAQKNSEAALHASEDQFRQLFEDNPLPMFLNDLDSLQILAVNDAAVELYGYSHDEWKALRTSDLRTVNEKTDARRLADDIVKNPAAYQSSKILQHVKKDGTIFSADMAFHRLTYNGHNAVLRVIDDLTNQLKAFAALRESEEQYRELFETNPHPMVISDLETGRFLAANDAAIEKYGYSREEFIGMEGIQLRIPEEQRQMTELFNQVRQENRLYIAAGVSQHRKKDGSVLYVEVAAHQTNYHGRKAIVAVGYDVTERLKALAALQQSEEQYRQLFASNPHPMVVTDVFPGKFLAVNDAALAKFGYTRDEFKSLQRIDLIHPESREEATQLFEKYVHEHMAFLASGVLRLQHKDGSSLFGEIAAHTINYFGQPAIVAVAYDMNERMKAEAALRESEERSRAVLESMPIMLAATDEQGKFVVWNMECERVTGYSAEEMIGNPRAYDLLLPDPVYRQAVRDHAREAAGNYRDWEMHLTARDGSQRHIVWSNIAREFPMPGWAAWSVGIDITGRKRAEDASRRSEARLSGVLESAMDAIITTDAHHHIVYFNAAAEKMFLCSSEQALGQPINNFVPQRFRDSHQQYIESFGHEGVTSRNMGHLGAVSGLRANGEEFPVEASISRLETEAGQFFTVILRDITERKMAEDEIRRSEELFSTIFRSVPVAISIISVETRRFLRVNGYMLRMTGFEAEELIGQVADDAPFWTNPQQLSGLAQSVREGRYNATDGAEFEWRTKSGQILTMFGSAIQIDINGQACILGLALDISDRKLAEQEHIEAEKLRLEVYKEREVLELKETFISTMSHEFRTPLTVITTAKESLLKFYDRMTPERRVEKLKTIEEQVNYVTALLDEVLTISKARAGKMVFNPVPLNLSAFCQNLFEQMQATDTQNHRFVFTDDEQISEIAGDTNLLQHILINLISNAIKYSPQGGEVRLEIRRENDQVRLQVSDEGIGIPEADQKYLFEPFYRATNTGVIKGTGLGLAIVKESVEVHGGIIRCVSTPGSGTSFIIHLPILETA